MGLVPGSSAQQLKEERVANTRQTILSSHNGEKPKQAGREDSVLLHVTSAAENRKPKYAKELDGNAVPIGELDTSRRKRKPPHNKVFAKKKTLLSWLVVHNAIVASLIFIKTYAKVAFCDSSHDFFCLLHCRNCLKMII